MPLVCQRNKLVPMGDLVPIGAFWNFKENNSRTYEHTWYNYFVNKKAMNSFSDENPLCDCCFAYDAMATPVACTVCGKLCVNAGCPGRDGRCERCGIRQGTQDWVGDGGALAAVHGFSSRYCEQCVLECQIDYAEEAAARLPGLKKKLAVLLEK